MPKHRKANPEGRAHQIVRLEDPLLKLRGGPKIRHLCGPPPPSESVQPIVDRTLGAGKRPVQRDKDAHHLERMSVGSMTQQKGPLFGRKSGGGRRGEARGDGWQRRRRAPGRGRGFAFAVEKGRRARVGLVGLGGTLWPKPIPAQPRHDMHGPPRVSAPGRSFPCRTEPQVQVRAGAVSPFPQSPRPLPAGERPSPQRGEAREMGDERVKAEALQILGLFEVLPRLVVFDLDYTLWPFYCECRSKRDSPSLFRHARGIMYALKEKGVDMAIASRSPTPDIAKVFLDKLELQSMFVAQEIFSSWTHKTEHFQKIQRKTGIPYKSMLFFDDEDRNIETVSKMGVTSVLVENGVNLDMFKLGLSNFATNFAASSKKRDE
ncbi:hypothetical protein U9M48_010503 [Paspalum notatum var. saurae]|uniref:Magnesium-dependent phosphatase 1 n=1 Tax=Paspalum notatum var. saurae TaxID=547442 RepID=A0AAQ3SV76_PASNO